MEGVKRFNPFYWVALRKMSRAGYSNFNVTGSSLSLRSHVRAKQSFNRSFPKRAVRVLVVAFLTIVAPIYAYIGMRPVSSVEASSYPELSIPSIGLETPVTALEMVDRQLIAPATVAGSYSQNKNKTLIIGHSSSVFKRLSQVRLGNEVQYGEKAYVVTNAVTVEKAEVNMGTLLAETDANTIILMTCAGEPLPDQDATHRLIITARAK